MGCRKSESSWTSPSPSSSPYHPPPPPIQSIPFRLFRGRKPNVEQKAHSNTHTQTHLQTTRVPSRGPFRTIFPSVVSVQRERERESVILTATVPWAWVSTLEKLESERKILPREWESVEIFKDSRSHSVRGKILPKECARSTETENWQTWHLCWPDRLSVVCWSPIWVAGGQEGAFN